MHTLFHTLWLALLLLAGRPNTLAMPTIDVYMRNSDRTRQTIEYNGMSITHGQERAIVIKALPWQFIASIDGVLAAVLNAVSPGLDKKARNYVTNMRSLDGHYKLVINYQDQKNVTLTYEVVDPAQTVRPQQRTSDGAASTSQTAATHSSSSSTSSVADQKRNAPPSSSTRRVEKGNRAWMQDVEKRNNISTQLKQLARDCRQQSNQTAPTMLKVLAGKLDKGQKWRHASTFRVAFTKMLQTHCLTDEKCLASVQPFGGVIMTQLTKGQRQAIKEGTATQALKHTHLLHTRIEQIYKNYFETYPESGISRKIVKDLDQLAQMFNADSKG